MPAVLVVIVAFAVAGAAAAAFRGSSVAPAQAGVQVSQGQPAVSPCKLAPLSSAVYPCPYGVSPGQSFIAHAGRKFTCGPDRTYIGPACPPGYFLQGESCATGGCFKQVEPGYAKKTSGGLAVLGRLVGEAKKVVDGSSDLCDLPLVGGAICGAAGELAGEALGTLDSTLGSIGLSIGGPSNPNADDEADSILATLE